MSTLRSSVVEHRMRTHRRLRLPGATFRRFGPVAEAKATDAKQPPRDVGGHEITRMVRLGAIWALGSQIAGQAIRFLSVVALSRLLTPSEYGAASIAVTIGSFSTTLGDLGFGTALVQASNATQRRASTACWSALGAGALGSGIVALGAYPAALALGEPSVTALVLAGGLTLFLVAAGSASNALLMRSMSFGVIQGATLAASILAASCAIAVAAAGGGAWALVLQQLVLAGATSCLFIFVARWRPSFQFSRSSFRSLAKFAMPVTGGALFGFVQPLIAALLIGAMVGVHALGIWSLSMAIVVVPATLFSYPLARVIYAAFARMRNEPKRVAEVWLNGFTSLSAVVLPALFGLVAVAPDIIPLAFGSRWEAAVPVVQILAVFFMARTLQTWNTPVMDAFGKPQIATILNALILVVLPPAIWLGSKWGVEGVAVAFSLASLLCGEVPSFVITTRALSLNGFSVLARLRGIVLSSAAVCVGVALLRQNLQAAGMGLQLRVVLCVLAGAAIYAGCLAISAQSVARDLLRMARGFAPALRPAR